MSRTAEQMQQKNNERVTYWAERIIKLVALKAPDVIIAHTMMALFKLSYAHYGEHMEEEFAKWLRDASRRYIGQCLQCEAEAEETQLHLCKPCRNKMLAEAAEYEALTDREDKQGAD